MIRRAVLVWLALAQRALAGNASGAANANQARETAQAAPRTLAFPRDHGAHPTFGIEWWYATGWLQREGAVGDTPDFGFQITFFRSLTGLAADIDSRFAARQLLFAHAALGDVAARTLAHAERIARWSGDPTARPAAAALEDTQVHLGAWRLARRGTEGYETSAHDESAAFGFDLRLKPTQPLLLQGESGFSRKGPQPHNASHYYSQPQLEASGHVRLRGNAPVPVRGRAWLDHEWSGSLMPAGAVGWEWIGMNLDDGSALTAFRLRDARGQALWSGGSWREREGAPRAFAADEVAFEALREWTSAATRARYGVHWRLRSPVGVFEVRAVFDAQELDSRRSTGAVYWEGLAGLHRAADGVRVGWGYLEMTGYASPLRL